MYKVVKDFFKSRFEDKIKLYIETNIEKYIKQYISQGYFDERIKNISLSQYLVFGDAQRLKISQNCVLNNALFNLSSGDIYIGEYVFFGHNVSLITGTHDYNKFGLERMYDFPKEGNDIVIEEGTWIASNVTVIGPCKIGKNSVVAAGAVVKGDVPSYHLVAGIPAKIVKEIKPQE
ncbi:acyltransferase [Mastigocladus laminosus UU774]|nr:serine acetyltransferase [Westiellopsis prolifica IICB1]TFI55840.1 acyltransferase [Mastigocladus laminosus UU774]